MMTLLSFFELVSLNDSNHSLKLCFSLIKELLKTVFSENIDSIFSHLISGAKSAQTPEV